MDFITWWFNYHFIGAIVVTPMLSLVYNLYIGSDTRAFCSFISLIIWFYLLII